MNSAQRRNNAIRGPIVVDASIRDFCWLDQPLSMPSNTAAGSSSCRTPSTRTSPAEPGISAKNPLQPVNGKATMSPHGSGATRHFQDFPVSAGVSPTPCPIVHLGGGPAVSFPAIVRVIGVGE